ncbi:MAG TPA: hypothetical protein VGM94_00420 [Galbitalea sp.]
MLEQTTVAGTDDWWLVQLATDFGADLPRLYRMQSYADGTNALPDEADLAMKDAYRRFIHMSRLNMAELIVAARVNRMKPLGFRTAAPGDQNGDAAAWATWNRSSMKVGARDFFTDAGNLGSAYLTTTGPLVPSVSAEPLILPSNGFSTVTRQYVLRPSMAEAALQVGFDDVNGADVLTLFRPGYMRQAIKGAKKSTVPSNGKKWNPGRDWTWVSDPIPLGYTSEVPVFKLAGRDGMGMFEKHLDSLDRITNGIRERLTITAMQAFRQRALSGDLPDEYPADHPLGGQKIDYEGIFKAGPAALWKLPSNVTVWESATTDITPVLVGSRDDVKNLAGVSSTPIYMLSPDAAQGSAEGASLAREALTFSTEEWIDRAERPIVMSLGTAFQGQADAVRSQAGLIEIIWASVDRSSWLEKGTAATASKSGGLPQRMIDEKIFGLSPAEIAQAEQDRSDEAFAQPLATS